MVIKKKRKGYNKYKDAVNRINLARWIKEEIEKKAERTIVVKIDDVAKEMGPEFQKVDYHILYQALKAILFQDGIFLSMATHKDGDKTFVLREVKEEDSYQLVKHGNIREIEEKKDGRLPPERVKRIIEEKLTIVEEKEKEMQEKIALREEIKKLKEILYGRLGRKSCMIEIFKFNWNTLTWKMVKRSSARTYFKLLDIVMSNTSNKDDRFRIEFTPLHQLEDMELDDKGEGEVVESGVMVKGGVEKEGKIEAVIEKEIECPRCGSKNIRTWPTVQIIKTRSGDRKLRHRCADCNETFSDEDLGII